jgi:phospholipid/cholesterol/gamma-HCH transport system substrate-binding protein
MNSPVEMLRQAPRAALVGVVVVVLLVAGLLTMLGSGDTRTVTAHFDRAVALFTGSEVRILGVPVGEVTAVVPEGETVRVEMTYDAEHDLPAEAQALIVTPTLTADRFVQLTPTYTSGPKLEDGATIEVENTGTPIELDRIYRSLHDLTRALGPNGVNRDGTLDHVLGAGAEFLDGRGRQAHETIVALSEAATTFGNASGDLFGTVRELEEFTGALAANDAAVSSFMENLGGVSQQLAGEKEELTAALANLAAILGKVERFVRDNRKLLNQDVADLARIMKVLGDQKKTLETILDIAPSALGNLHVAFDPETGTIGSRIRFEGNQKDLDGQLCTLVRSGRLPSAEQACRLFEALLEPVFARPSSAPSRPDDSGVSQVRHGSARSAADLSQLLGGQA